MDINIFWHGPIYLQDGAEEHMIYTVGDLSKFEEVPGVYMFCRIYGDDLIPLYIGKALDLAARIEQQLNTTKLMKHIEHSPSGTRVLVLGEFKCKPGQKVDKCLRITEKALIEHALAEEYELVNQQGTKTPYNVIEFKGNSKAKGFTGPRMHVRKTGD